jgi:D-aminoacyl-tRNA deacylase
MKALLQRVSQASVTVQGEIVGQIGKGLLVLLGVGEGDTLSQVKTLVDKTLGLRIFDDSNGKMNLSVQDIRGSLLVVSQFTLLGDCRKGRRPSFIQAAPPTVAEHLYESFVSEVAARGVPVATGRFRTHMEVALINDGPVTILLEENSQNVSP